MVVVFHDRLDELAECLESLLPEQVSVVVIDVSKGSSAQGVANRFSFVTYRAAPENRGYGWACNLGISIARTEVVIVSNSDVMFLSGSVAILEAAVANRKAIAAPIQLVRRGGPAGQDSLQPLPGMRTALTKWLWIGRKRRDAQRAADLETMLRASETRDVAGKYALSGACVAASSESWKELQGFDEGFFLYEEDIDLSLRAAAASHSVLLVSPAQVVHESGTNDRGLAFASLNTAARSEQRLWRKHRIGRSFPVRVLQVVGLLLRGFVALITGRTGAARTYAKVAMRARA